MVAFLVLSTMQLTVVTLKVRRTAEIAFGDPKLEEYLDLKNYRVNPQREAFGWTSNNSVCGSILCIRALVVTLLIL